MEKEYITDWYGGKYDCYGILHNQLRIFKENGVEYIEVKLNTKNTINKQRILEKTCINNDEVDNGQVSVQMENRSYNQVRILEEEGVKYLEIKLSDKHNHVMLCDIEDYKLVISRRWYAKSKVKSEDGCYRCVDGDSVAFHRLLFPQWAVISHINKNQLDNQQFNLYNGRIQAKTYGNNKSGYNERKMKFTIRIRILTKILMTMITLKRKKNEILNFMELEEDDIGIDREDYIDPEEGLNIELIPMNTSEHVNNQEYNMEEVFDFEKFNDDQFNEQ
ncbi:12104_t:CDS:2, partial [Acaulospora colombiana]